MTPPLKAYPPGVGQVLIPTASRQAAALGMTLYAPARRWTVAAHRALYVVNRFLGPKLLPGRKRTWRPDFEATRWSALVDNWRDVIGSFDQIAIYDRMQPGRSGFAALLIQHDRPLAFLKVGLESMAREISALVMIEKFRPSTFTAPHLVAHGATEGLYFLAMDPVLAEFHRPEERARIRPICTEITQALAALSRPHDIPPHWTPMHGDFTPWNLRRVADNRSVLVDWEEVSWGPPGADRVCFEAAEVALGRHGAVECKAEEAIAYWISKGHEHVTRAADSRLWEDFSAALRRRQAE